MQKEYTKVRQFYAWVGFITIAVLAIYGALKVGQFIQNHDAAIMQTHYCFAEDINGDLVHWECDDNGGHE